MRRDKTIQALDLTQAQIASNLDGSAGYNDKGIEALAVALSVNSTLKSLKLFANHLRDESVDHIVKIVLGNDTLKSLNVDTMILVLKAFKKFQTQWHRASRWKN